jgi:polyketide cyclase/dehydrase/lipid transport protein
MRVANVSSNITINQPADKVFTYVVSVENHKAWQAAILDAKLTPPGPPALGSIYHYTTDVLGRKYESQMQISGFEPNKKWAVKTMGVPRPVETVYQFEPAGAGTKLTISMELTGGYPAAAEGMVKQQMQKSLDEQCHRIKQMVEK